MMTMSPVLSLRSEGRGLPKNIAGFAIGVEPMIRKSISPPPCSMAEPAAPRRSASVAPGLAHAIELLGALDDDQLVDEAAGEHDLGLGQARPQVVILIDRHVILVARIELDQADAAAREPDLLEALD